MKNVILIWFAIAQLSILTRNVSGHVASTKNPIVNTSQGKVKGVLRESAVHKRKYAAFFGVPYAEPPLGSLRFKEPVAPKPWKEAVREAVAPPPACIQLDLFSLPEIKVVGSEDCLYVNVFTPQLPTSNSQLLSVIVHIHGGAFAAFSGNDYGPERLMDKDVVYVSFNYRLGPLGFLSMQDSELPGNNGLKDQTEALKWIKKNIANFGGDPDSVTITGDSAGAASVLFHMVSPRSQGLFKRVIAESGTSLSPWALNESPRVDAVNLAMKFACPNGTSGMIRCLRKIPAERILLQSDEPAFTGESDFFPYVPVIEPENPTAFITKPFLEIIKKGMAQDVPLILSFADAEGLLIASGYLTSPVKAKRLETNWTGILPDILNYRRVVRNDKIPEVSNAIRRHYLQNKSINESVASFVKMFSDRGYFYTAEMFTKLYADRYSSPVYAYQFSYKGKKRSIDPFPREIYDGATHIENTVYVLPSPKILDVDPSDFPMVASLVDLWVDFATGKPMMRKWKTVKDGLPKFNFLDVSKAAWDDNEIKSYEDFSNSKFWKSLDIQDNVMLSVKS